MEFTEDMLRRIANTITDLYAHVSAQEKVLEEIRQNPQEVDKMVREARQSPHYQMIRNEMFEKLKGVPPKGGH